MEDYGIDPAIFGMKRSSSVRDKFEIARSRWPASDSFGYRIGTKFVAFSVAEERVFRFVRNENRSPAVTIRVDVTSAYRMDIATPKHVGKRDSLKKETDRDASPTTDQTAQSKPTGGKASEVGAVVAAVKAKQKSAVTGQSRTPTATDVFVHSPATAATKPKAEQTYQPLDVQRPKLLSPTGPQVGKPNAEDTPAKTDASLTTEAAPPNPESTPSSEAVLQHELAQALNFGQTTESLQEAGRHSGDMVRHLQSEGVFGISPSGRNLGATDFIRQKKFEYEMDQKPFRKDDLLLETEKAIYGTLNSSQSSSVTKSLLQAAESVNHYRNQTLKADEPRDVAPRAAPARAATHT